MDTTTRVALITTLVIPCLTGFTRSASHAQQSTTPTPSVLAGIQLRNGPAQRFELPRRYREVSGLALSPDGRLFGHNDELAIIFQVDYNTGRMVKAFALGQRTAAGDFEGITVAEGRHYLVTSDGQIFESTEDRDGARVLYNTYHTSTRRACEVEGLAYDPTDRTLIMVCKTPRSAALRGRVTLFKWSLETHAMARDSMLQIPITRITSRIDDNEFNPSGIVRDPTTGHYLIVAARQAAIIEITPAGDVVATHEFPSRAHRQLEGVELTADGRLLLADEGRNGRAQLTVYVPSRVP